MAIRISDKKYSRQGYHLAHIAVPMLLLLAACGGTGAPSATPGTQPGTEAAPASTDGFVVLEDDINLDNFNFDFATSEPVTPVTLTLDEARAALPFELALPGWAPDGFVLQPEVEVIQSSEGGYASAILTWLNPDQSAIHLQVAATAEGRAGLGAAGSSEITTVNGAPATLVRSTSLGTRRLSLTWPLAGLSYSLSVEAGAATGADLLRMAESTP